MKYLIDLGQWNDRDFIIVEAGQDAYTLLKKETFDIIAFGEQFLTFDARQVSMKDLALLRKPAELSQAPTIESSKADFEKWQAWKLQVQDLRISGGGWDNCISAMEHHSHLVVQYEHHVNSIKKWQETWMPYL